MKHQLATLRARKLYTQYQALKESDPCQFFVPNGAQERFINAVGKGDHFITMFIAANGVGKDATLANIEANLIWGVQSKYFDLPVFRNWPYLKRMRICTESNLVKKGGPIDQEIKHWWPRGRYDGLAAGKPYISEYRTDTGWVVDKMSYDQDRKDFEGANLGVILFSEPPPEDVFDACVGRMRGGGLMIMGFTPLTNAGWMLDRLVDNQNENVVIINADIEENCKQHGTRGVLEHADLERLISTWADEEREARTKGTFMQLGKCIFSGSFKRNFHIVPNELDAPPNAQWGLVIDPARGKPWAMGLFWVDSRGQIVFDSEYPEGDYARMKESNYALKDYVSIIKNMTAGKRMSWWIIDRHYANTRDDKHHTLKGDLYDDYNLDFEDSYNSEEEINTGIQKIKDYFRFNEKFPIDTVNFPRLLIKERCKNIIKGLERWGREDDGTPSRTSPYKDHVDCVRYAVMAEPEIYISRPLAPKNYGYVLGH